MKRKMKQWLSMFLVAVMLITLIPCDITYAEELPETTEATTELETSEQEISEERITEAASEETTDGITFGIYKSDKKHWFVNIILKQTVILFTYLLMMKQVATSRSL